MKATAEVRITLQITAGVWSDDCKIGQIFEQAREHAIGTICNAIEKKSLPYETKIVGTPTVTAIMAEKG